MSPHTNIQIPELTVLISTLINVLHLAAMHYQSSMNLMKYNTGV